MSNIIDLKAFRRYDPLKDPGLHRTAKMLSILRDQGRAKAEILEILQISERHYWRLRARIKAREGGTDMEVRGTDMDPGVPGGQVSVKTTNSLMKRGLTFPVGASSNLLYLSLSFKDKRDCIEEKKEEGAMPETIPYQEIIEDLNQKSGKKFKWTAQANKDLIKARWKDGYSLEDFKLLHTNMCLKWKKDSKMNQYLRPETLYRPAHFESYLNSTPIQNITKGMAETKADVENRPINTSLMHPRIRALKEKFEK